MAKKIKQKWVLEESDYNVILNAKKMGMREDNIGLLFGICRTAWIKLKNEDKRIQEIMDIARAEGEIYVISQLWDLIKDKNHKSHAQAVIFWLKTRARWSEARDVTVNNERPSSFELIDIGNEDSV